MFDPCWLYATRQPYQFRLCTEKQEWYRLRRNGWGVVKPETVAKAVQSYIRAHHIAMHNLVVYLSGTLEEDREHIEALVTGQAKPIMYTLDTLDRLAGAMSVSMLDLYVIAPDLLRMDAVGPSYNTPKIVDGYEVQGEALRVYHILYRAHGEATMRRAHVVASSVEAAESIVFKFSGGVALETSSQRLVEGLIIDKGEV